MREELMSPKVEGVAIVQEKGENDTTIYNTYLLNLKGEISIDCCKKLDSNRKWIC
jgi:hypothetical protein